MRPQPHGEGMAYTYNGLTDEYLAQARGSFLSVPWRSVPTIRALVGTAGIDFTRASMAR